MIRFLEIFAFVSVLLRALTLCLEALTLGGITFVVLVVRPDCPFRRVRQVLVWSAVTLALTQTAYLGVNSSVLVSSTDMNWQDLLGAQYCIAGVLMIIGAVAIVVFGRAQYTSFVYPLASAMILCGSVLTTHSVARLDSRFFAAALTLGHQAAAAAWVGGLPYLLLSLKYCKDSDTAIAITSRFSRLAQVCVAVLLVAAAGLVFLYVGSGPALLGTTYGIMVLGKSLLTGAVLACGALNLLIVRAVRSGMPPSLLPLKRFAEVEAGIGFTIILAAAALTSAPPAIDVQADRVTATEIIKRTKPRWPRLETPSWNELSPPTPLAPSDPGQLQSFVFGQSYRPPLPGDIAWSEYNHHWAGLIVLAMGVLAVVARRFIWARNWPIIFVALAVFILVRADPENWPLGPRSFWSSFQVAEVMQHRFFVLLLIAFAASEWAVQTGRISKSRAGLVFPLVCVLGGALLLVHSHSVNNVKEEFLAELSHLPLAVLAIFAGWSRWLEIRLPRYQDRIFGWIWCSCLVLIGLILLNYRES